MPDKYIKKYELPLTAQSTVEIVEELTLFLLSELKSWKISLNDEAFSSILGAAVGLSVNEANLNDGNVDLKKSMVIISSHLNNLGR